MLVTSTLDLDIVPNGLSVNLPPFLEHGRFTESEVTKSIARCRIHVERANARLKGFKILKFSPSLLIELCRPFSLPELRSREVHRILNRSRPLQASG